MRNGMLNDSCMYNGSGKACDVDSGVCGGPVAIPDSGQPMMEPDPITLPEVEGQLGAQASTCGCGAGGAVPLLLGLLSWLRRRSPRKNW